MAILMMLLGATILGGMFLSDGGSEPENDEGDLSSEDQNDEALSEGTNPLSVAINSDEDVEVESPDGDDSSTSDEDGEVIYDGSSDEAMGYTDKSFGIAHRYYENQVVEEQLVGSEDDDTIFVGAGSSANGGDGSDVFDVFIPAALVGVELVEVEDFEPSQDTLIVRMESETLEATPTSETMPTVDMSYADGVANLAVNGADIAQLDGVTSSLEIAFSFDGNAEDFVDADGVEIPDDELQNYNVQLVWMSDQAIYGL